MTTALQVALNWGLAAAVYLGMVIARLVGGLGQRDARGEASVASGSDKG